jgi:hypothetical protein
MSTEPYRQSTSPFEYPQGSSWSVIKSARHTSGKPQGKDRIRPAVLATFQSVIEHPQQASERLEGVEPGMFMLSL